MLFCFLKIIKSVNLILNPHEQEEFSEDLKKGTNYRIEYGTEFGEDVHFKMVDDKMRNIIEYNTSSNVIHTRAEEDMKIFMRFKNINSNPLKLKFSFPDLDNDAVDSTVSKAENIQSITELESKLNSIILKTTEYNEKMNFFSQKMSSYKWKIRLFMTLELLFSLIMIYFLHKDTVGLFERRRKI